MPVPFAVAAPAAIAAAAYVNAKAQIWYDVYMLNCVSPMLLSMHWRERLGKLSLFYDLEHFGTNPKIKDRPFLLFQDEMWSFEQSLALTLRYGTWLREKFGIEKDDIVAMNFPNSDRFVFIWMGLWSIGAKPAFINYNLTGEALLHCIKAATTKLIFIDPAVAYKVDERVRKALPRVRFEILTPQYEAEVAATRPVRMPDEARSVGGLQDMAILIYTSGTTGLPKAAVVSWGKVHAAAGFSSRFIGAKPGEIFYTCMPLYHSSGSIVCLANVLFSGATIALGEKFSTRTFWQDVRQHNATMIQYVGETLRYLLAAPSEIDPETGENMDKRHRVRIAHGNGLRPDVWTRFKERFGVEYIAEFYGATEGSFATWNLSRNNFSAGAVGRNGWLYRLLVGTGTALVEVDFNTDMPYRDPKTGLCRAARSGEPGEFLFKLPDKEFESRFQGYHGDREATNKKILREAFKKGDAWFRTGDIMRLDSEGRLFFHDRIGDTFRWKSENVSTAEVSQALGLHPAVHEANVYGVRLPHHDGRAGCVGLVLNDFVSEGPIDDKILRSLAAHVHKELPKYAAPIFLRLMKHGEMQTTGTNKQQKHHLRLEGVDPEKAGGDRIYWLRENDYVRFTQEDWDALHAGRVKL